MKKKKGKTNENIFKRFKNYGQKKIFIHSLCGKTKAKEIVRRFFSFYNKIIIIIIINNIIFIYLFIYNKFKIKFTRGAKILFFLA